MKFLLAFIITFISFGALAQKVIDVNSKMVDLGVIEETLHGDTKSIILRVSPASPENFKVSFIYKYRVYSQKINGAFIGPTGKLALSGYTVASEIYDRKNKLMFDVSESTANKGDDLEILIKINKPSKDSNWINVDVTLNQPKGNTVSGGKKLMGLLGRSYQIKSGCE